MPAPTKWISDFELANLQSPEGEPWLSASPDGRFALAYAETLYNPAARDIELEIYSAAAVAQSSPNVTASSATDEHQPAIAWLPDGRRVTVWTEEPRGGGGGEDVYAAVFFGNNVIDVPRFPVIGTGAGKQLDPIVAAGSDGFVIGFTDDSTGSNLLMLDFFSISGQPIFSGAIAPQVVNPFSGDLYRDVEIEALANGNYVVAWTGDAPFDIHAQIYAPEGNAVSGVIDVDPGNPSALFPDATALADGRFVITYLEYGTGEVRGRAFEADGMPLAASFTIAAGAANAPNQQVQSAALNDGRFVTVWRTIGGDIEGQVMKADGTPDGAAFAVNGDAAGGKGRPTVATLADGRFAVSWESGAGATATIFTTIFEPREAGLSAAASGLNDDWIGTGFTDTIFGAAGNDRFAGAGGIDYLHGEAGQDTLNGDAGADRLYGGNDNDTLNGGLDGDFLYGGLGNDFLNGDAGNDSAYGQDGNDTLNGGADSDTLDGGNGNDVVIGGAGNDNLRGRSGNDTLNGGTENDDARGGNGTDTIDGDDGDDTFLSGEQGTDTVHGGNGNDRIDGGSEVDQLFGDANSDNITGGTGDDNISGGDGDDGNGLGVLKGEDGNDTIHGDNGIDRLDGGIGNDSLFGDAGNDVLMGGAGLDRFCFASSTEGNDRVDDWTAIDDQIQVSVAGFSNQLDPGSLPPILLVVGAAPVANQPFAQFLYNTATGQLSFDADGTGAGAAVNICRLLNGGVAVATLAAADIDVVA